MSSRSTRELYVELCAEPPARPPRAPSTRRLTPPRGPAQNHLADVARLLEAEPIALTGRSRAVPTSRVRQDAMWLLYHGRALSTVAIGRLLGDRDPTTIRYGILEADERRRDPATLARLDRLLATLKG